MSKDQAEAQAKADHELRVRREEQDRRVERAMNEWRAGYQRALDESVESLVDYLTQVIGWSVVPPGRGLNQVGKSHEQG